MNLHRQHNKRTVSSPTASPDDSADSEIGSCSASSFFSVVLVPLLANSAAALLPKRGPLAPSGNWVLPNMALPNRLCPSSSDRLGRDIMLSTSRTEEPGLPFRVGVGHGRRGCVAVGGPCRGHHRWHARQVLRQDSCHRSKRFVSISCRRCSLTPTQRLLSLADLDSRQVVHET